MLVLLVEDEPLLREMMQVILEDAGHEVLSAEDGEVAMEKLQTYDGKIQALVTDIKLPKGPNGWEIARRARMRSGDMHVLYMTGESEHEWGIHGVPRGRMLQKPFAPPRVVSELEDFQL
jgi:DNA-binding response OmpR family regulator